MARAIDADALQELCNTIIQDEWNSRTAPESWAEAYESFKDDIDSMPTITPPNEPLTIEQLREMDGEPAWWDDGEGSFWGIISVDSRGMWGGIPFFRGRWREVNFEYNMEKRKMKIYRLPPEGEGNA